MFNKDLLTPRNILFIVVVSLFSIHIGRHYIGIIKAAPANSSDEDN